MSRMSTIASISFHKIYTIYNYTMHIYEYKTIRYITAKHIAGRLIPICHRNKISTDQPQIYNDRIML